MWSSDVVSVLYRCEESLKRRTFHWSPSTISWVIDALSAPPKAKARLLVAWAQSAPMTPP